IASLILNFLAIPKSVFTRPGPIRVFLPVGLSQKRPKLTVAGHVNAAKDAGFRKPSAGLFPLIYGFPIIAGRSVVWPSRFVSRDCDPFKMGMGTPFCSGRIPSIDQPPSQRRCLN